ncbi:MAG TPA: thioesterase family protein [Acholeplasmataceae bacterium]|nr:thioesterase family protein [Acholeplasmataceae bacterium]
MNHKYPLKTIEKVRYGDTDRQGHVNNAIFNEYFESGRVELLYHPHHPLNDEQCSFVTVHVSIDYHDEINWPGELLVQTGIKKIGTSSIRFIQSLYQDDVEVATCEAVIVHVNPLLKKSQPLREDVRELLKQYVISE